MMGFTLVVVETEFWTDLLLFPTGVLPVWLLRILLMVYGSFRIRDVLRHVLFVASVFCYNRLFSRILYFVLDEGPVRIRRIVEPNADTISAIARQVVNDGLQILRRSATFNVNPVGCACLPSADIFTGVDDGVF